jgi:hypothetical protein
VAQGLPPNSLISSSRVRPCSISHAWTRSISTGSGRRSNASSASSGRPQRRSTSATSCLLYEIVISTTKPPYRPDAAVARPPRRGGRPQEHVTSYPLRGPELTRSVVLRCRRNSSQAGRLRDARRLLVQRTARAASMRGGLFGYGSKGAGARAPGQFGTHGAWSVVD